MEHQEEIREHRGDQEEQEEHVIRQLLNNGIVMPANSKGMDLYFTALNSLSSFPEGLIRRGFPRRCARSA